MAEFFSIARFVVDKRSGLTMTDTYQEIANVTIVGAEVGTYEFGISSTHNYDQANKNEFIRFSLDGGTIWTEFSTPPNDPVSDEPFIYYFFKEGVSGDLNLVVQARKQDATGVMVVSFVDAYIRRVK